MHLTWQQIVGLFVLAIPIACIARTVVFEEVFREPREFFEDKSKHSPNPLVRKFFYLFTCEYCFSHWVTLVVLIVTRYQLMYTGWRGYLVAFFSLVFVANFYLNLYARMRVEITGTKKEIEAREHEIEVTKKEIQERDRQIQKLDVELSDSRADGEEGNAGNGRR